MLNDIEVPSIEVLRPRSDGSLHDSVALLSRSVDSVIGFVHRALTGERGGVYGCSDVVVATVEKCQRTAGDGGGEERAQIRDSQ